MEPRGRIPGAGATGQNAWLKGGSHGCKSGKPERTGKKYPPPRSFHSLISSLCLPVTKTKPIRKASRREAWEMRSVEDLASWEQREGQRLDRREGQMNGQEA